MQNRKACIQYVEKIRNPEKRRYAAAYYHYLTGFMGQPDDAQFAIGAMAKQAVRMNLSDLIKSA